MSSCPFLSTGRPTEESIILYSGAICLKASGLHSYSEPVTEDMHPKPESYRTIFIEGGIVGHEKFPAVLIFWHPKVGWLFVHAWYSKGDELCSSHVF